MVDSINKVNEQTYKKPGFWTCAVGTAVGFSSIGLPNIISSKLQSKMGSSLIESSKVNSDEFKQINEGITKTLQNTGLSAKGVSIIKYSTQNEKEIEEILKRENPILSKIKSKTLKNILGLPDINNFKNGENALYSPLAKKIIMPSKELSLVTFHEMGHASTYVSKVGKFLPKIKYLSLLGLPVLLIGLLKTKKAPDEKPKNKIDKITDLIKNNAGKLFFLFTSAPILIDEALASIKGGKYAKKVLDPALVKKLSKSNKYGFLTYLSGALASSIGVAIGVKVKDAIAKPKLVKNEK